MINLNRPQWQVLNEYGNPASNDFDDLCIFPTREKARRWLKYLKEECSVNTRKFRIRKVIVMQVA